MKDNAPALKIPFVEQVVIIASGYEWDCPHCEGFNEEIEFTEYVTCSECKSTFQVNDHLHATE